MLYTEETEVYFQINVLCDWLLGSVVCILRDKLSGRTARTKSFKSSLGDRVMGNQEGAWGVGRRRKIK